MTNTELDQLTTECLNARDAYIADLAVLSAENAQLKTAIARKDFQIDSLQLQVAALVKRADACQAECSRLNAKDWTAAENERVDTNIMAHLRDGDGTFVVAEHTADGLTIAFFPDVAKMRSAMLSDIYAVRDGVTLVERQALLGMSA